jgi:hypothetical protein
MITKNTQQLAQEVKKHIDADSVTQGYYWEDGKGCFIGCLAHGNDVQQLSVTYGLSVGLTRICEAIFEGLSPEDAKQFFADFPDAIGYDGKNLSLVLWQFLEDVLRNLPAQKPEIQSVIDPVIAGIGLLAKGEKWNHDTARAAVFSAHVDAAVYDTARAAASASHAVDAAMAALSWAIHDHYKAYAAAQSAAFAGDGEDVGTPYVAEYKRQRDVLLKLIRQAV